MRVEAVVLTHFRNLENQTLSFSPGVNILIGENGQGKTNVLESIQLFKFARSFRATRDTEMIRFGETFCRVEVQCLYESSARDSIACAIEQSGTKKIQINKEDLPKLLELVGKYPCVLFGPHDLRLVSGAPEDRRRFLDMVGSMCDRRYIDLLREYRRVLKQRNASLKSRAPRSARKVWDDELVARGAGLVIARRALLRKIAAGVTAHASSLDVPGEFRLSYESAIISEAGAFSDSPDDPGVELLSEVFAAKLAALQGDEERRGTTLAGPHRDDIRLLLDGKDLRKFGSQGQRRLCAILLKMAELTEMETVLEEPCVLLLDDVFSEFDPEITARLQHLLDGTRQVFITSPVPLDWVAPESVKRFHVSGGRVAT